MTTAPGLPRGLEPWGEALAALEPALATALLPIVHALEDLFGRRLSELAYQGDPDGYDGLATRGTPERIVMSEWALADEAPLEFLRRAASGELLHLAQAFRRPRRVGRVVAFVDNGVEQLGAPRLAQLAALVVLYRRAHASGTELAVGLLSDPPGQWVEGDVGAVLRRWRRDRTTRQPTADDVAGWDARLAHGDEAWVLTGPELAGALRRPRVASVRLAGWTATGPATLHVDLDGDTAELALPATDMALRAIRGTGLVTPHSHAVETRDVRCPSFSTVSARLLLRGAGPRELLSVTVASNPGDQASRVRRHSYPAPVVAAAHIGKRLVALLADDDDTLRVQVSGKPIAWLDDIAVPFAAVGEDIESLTAGTEDALPPLHLLATELLVGLGGAWHALQGERARRTAYVAVAPGENLDQPLRVSAVPPALRVNDVTRIDGATDTHRVVVGARRWVAVSADGRSWLPFAKHGPWQAIVVDPADEVLALTAIYDEPHLVTRSPGGLVLRLVSAGKVRTLTRWSGAEGGTAIHPVLPWAAVQRAPDVVEVGHLLTGAVLHVVRGGT